MGTPLSANASANWRKCGAHDVNERCDDRGWRNKTVLSAAVDGNAPLAVRLLLRRGANPNLQDGDGDRYPLHWASAFGDHAECAELLVQAGAQKDLPDKDGWTPLHAAADNGEEAVAQLLLEAGAQKDLATKGGWTPLRVAENNGREALVRLLR